MKMKNVVLGVLLMGSLTLVGCDDIKDTGSAIEEPTKKVEEKVEDEKAKVEEKTDVEKDAEVKNEEPKKEIKKEEPKKEVKKGQCYDCGEYYPIDQMSFNGRSYHCGCVACEVCGERMSANKAKTIDGFTMCKACAEWHKQENEQWEDEQQNDSAPEAGIPTCSQCGKNPAAYVESELCEECAGQQ